MTDYTEAQIHELTGRDLDAAVHEIVLGDDLTANTDERLNAVVKSNVSSHPTCTGINVSVRRGCGWGHPSVIPWQNEYRHGLYDHLHVWSHRHGQPWQADLEAHVRDWRAEPDEWDLNRCIPELMGPGKVLGPALISHEYVGYDAVQCLNGEWSIFKTLCGLSQEDIREPVVKYAPCLATAIKRAACIVKLREQS